MTLTRLLSSRMLLGEPVPGYTPRRPPLWQQRLPDANQLGATLRQAALQGYDGLVLVNDLRLLAAVKQSGRPLPLVPVLPNIQGYVRDAVDYGLVGAGLRRLRQLSPPSLGRIGLVGLGRLPGLARSDFRATLRVLFEVEASAFLRYEPRRAYLAAQFTDLAVALDAPDYVQVFLQTLQRYNITGGLVTHNTGPLLAWLARHGITPPPLMAPFNRQGYLMLPGQREVEQALQPLAAQVTADVVSVGAPPGADELDYLQDHGITEAVFDVDSL